MSIRTLVSRIGAVTSGVFFFCAAASGQVGVTGGGYRGPSLSITPGQVVTLFVHGLTAPVAEEIATSAPLPTKLGGFEIMLRQGGRAPLPVPIFGIKPFATCEPASSCQGGAGALITVHIPFDLTLGGNLLCCDAAIAVYQEGQKRLETRVHPVADQVHLISDCDDALPRTFVTPVGQGGPCQTPVYDTSGRQISITRPAKAGDVLTVYGYGLGALDAAIPPGDRVATGEIPTRPLRGAGTIWARYNFAANAGPSGAGKLQTGMRFEGHLWSGVIPGAIGLYQVNLKVPAVPPGLPRCGALLNEGEMVVSNLTITVGGVASFDGVRLCVEP